MEQVLCFPAKLLDELGTFQGTSVDTEKYLPSILNNDNLKYILRSKAETDPSYKQLIPYCVLRNRGKVFTYQRTSKGGEARLHNLYSLGVGGHINPVDDNGISIHDTYYAAFQRELSEEVHLEGTYRETIVGLLYDDTTEVGQVHFGVVHRLTLKDNCKLTCKDKALANGEWKDILWLKKNKEQFEKWSQFVIEDLL